MNLIKNRQLLLALLLEIGAILILSYWGFTLQMNRDIRILTGVLAPVLLIIVWGVWCAPSSNARLTGLWLLLTKIILFGIVTYCLFSMKQNSLAIGFGFCVLINLGLSIYFKSL